MCDVPTRYRSDMPRDDDEISLALRSERRDRKRFLGASGLSLWLHLVTGGLGLMWVSGHLLGGQPDALPVQVDLVTGDEWARLVQSMDASANNDGHSDESAESQDADSLSPSLASTADVSSTEHETFAVRSDESMGAASLVTRPPRPPKSVPMRRPRKSSEPDLNRAARWDTQVGEVQEIGFVMPQRVIQRHPVRMQRINYRQIEPHYGWLADMLKQRMEEMKRYPPAARSRGWEGKVVVQAAVNVSGRVQGVDVLRSSGHKILDEDALEMLRRVSPLSLNHPIADDEVIVEVPVRYELN